MVMENNKNIENS